jgi:hypothetical protein
LVRVNFFARLLKNSLVALFIGPFAYENLSNQGTFSALRVLKKSVENSGKMNGYGRMGDKNGWRYADG